MAFINSLIVFTWAVIYLSPLIIIGVFVMVWAYEDILATVCMKLLLARVLITNDWNLFNSSGEQVWRCLEAPPLRCSSVPPTTCLSRLGLQIELVYCVSGELLRRIQEFTPPCSLKLPWIDTFQFKAHPEYCSTYSCRNNVYLLKFPFARMLFEDCKNDSKLE